MILITIFVIRIYIYIGIKIDFHKMGIYTLDGITTAVYRI